MPSQTALPMRDLVSFLPGNGVGGAGVHWNGQTWRFLPTDFQLRSHLDRALWRGRAARRHDDSGLGRQLRRARALLRQVRISLRHFRQGRQYSRARCSPAAIRSKAARSPRISQSADEACPMRRDPVRRSGAQDWAITRSRCRPPTSREAYINPLGVQLGQCSYCGFCERFGCGNYSKASPQTTVLPVLMRKPNFELRHRMRGAEDQSRRDGKRATASPISTRRARNVSSRAIIVLLCAYALINVRMMLLSGIGKPYDPGRRGRRRHATTPTRPRRRDA